MNPREIWYGNKLVKFNLLTVMRNREVMFMIPDEKNDQDADKKRAVTLGWHIGNTQYMDTVFNLHHMTVKPYNLYVSCARFRYIPHFTEIFSERSKETQAWYWDKSDKGAAANVISFDILLDFDFKKPFQENKKFIDELKNLMAILDENKVCYGVHISSLNGVHIIFYGEDITVNQQIDFIRGPDSVFSLKVRSFVANIQERLNLSYLDIDYEETGVIDFKKVGEWHKKRKCEYSIVGDKVIWPSLIDNISFPLSYDTCLKLDLYNRGLVKINDFGQDKNREHFREFCRKLRLL